MKKYFNETCRNTSPDTHEIAKALCDLIPDAVDEQTLSECEEAIYYLKTLAANEYNSDFFRTFYSVLAEIAESEDE